MDLSIIVNSYKEPLMIKTVQSLLDNSVMNTEILCIINGNWFSGNLPNDKRLKVFTLNKNIGPRGAINLGIENAKGKYFMRLDAHCLFEKGFDRVLTETFEDNWIVIPRRYSLNDVTWDKDETRSPRDYHYLSFPEKTNYGLHSSPMNWYSRMKKRLNPRYDIDNTMTYQGSCWMAHKEYFMKHVGLLSEVGYGPGASDNLQVGVRYWLSGGEVKVNKKTWYAHLFKGKRHKKSGLYDFYTKRTDEYVKGFEWATRHWFNNEEPGMDHNLSWLVEKFWPIPGWPHNWEEVWRKNG